MEQGIIDVTLTVSPFYYGEYKDAKGMQAALERTGLHVSLFELPPVRNVRRMVNLPFRSRININFHSSYRPAKHALLNFLYFHEVHHQTDDTVPYDIFREYSGVFTPARAFAAMADIDYLPTAVDTTRIFRTEPDPKYEADVVYVANNHNERNGDVVAQLLLDIRRAGHTVALYGSGWEKYADIQNWSDIYRGKLPYWETGKAYSSAKVGLNYAVGGMVEWGTGTNRLYDMGACGLPTVSYRCDTYEEQYDEDAVVFADTVDEYVSGISRLLKDKEGLKARSDAILHQTLEKNTWDARMPVLLKALFEPSRGYDRKVSPSPDPPAFAHDLLIGIPSRDTGRVAFAMGLTSNMIMHNSVFDAAIEYDKGRYNVDAARNRICERALREKWNWLLFLDDDVKLTADVIVNLMEDVIHNNNVDIVCGWYKTLNPELHTAPEPLLFAEMPTAQGNTYLQRVSNLDIKNSSLLGIARTGAGCLLIRSNVLRSFRDAGIPWFKFVDDPLSEDYRNYGILSEDMWFCDRARELGYNIYVDPRCFGEHHQHCVYRYTDVGLGG